MNKKNTQKIIIISVIAITVVILLIFLLKPSKNPTKNIIGTSLDKKMEVTPNIDIIDNEVVIYEGKDTLYFDYRDGELIYENVIKKESNKNYVIEQNEYEYYLLNKKTNKKSEVFTDYYEVNINNNVQYLLLKMNENYVIYNTSEDKYIALSKNIVDFYNIYDAYDNLISEKYIIVIDSNEKLGVIDYNGKTIIDFKYDNLNIIGDNFLVRKDGKVGVIDKNENIILDFKYGMLFEYGDKYLSILDGKYGIIDSKGNVLLEHKYDFGMVKDSHVVLSLDGKAAFYTNKLIMEPTIELSEPTKLSTYTFNNNIHLLTNEKTYVIDKNGKLIKTLDYKLFLIMYGEKIDEYSDKYLYTREVNGNNVNFKIYDKNYNEHYTFDIKPNINLTQHVMNSSLITNDNKQYDIYLMFLNNDSESDNSKQLIYSYDFDNKKEITSNDLEKNTLENGITYVIDVNNNLTIYNKDKVIGEYKDILYFIDNYYFIDKNGIVYKLEFKYE